MSKTYRTEEIKDKNIMANTFNKKALFGKNICVTKSRSQESELKEKLRELGASVTEIETVKIVETTENIKTYIKNLKEYNHIIFSSANAVSKFFDYLKSEKFNKNDLTAKIYAVGRATNKAISQTDITSFAIAREFVENNLFEILQNEIKPCDKILFVCSSAYSSFTENELKKLGIKSDRLEVFKVVKSELLDKDIFNNANAILYTSPNTVNEMLEFVGIHMLKNKKSIAIGQVTAKSLKELGVKCLVCKKHSQAGFLEEISQMNDKI